MGQLIDIPYSVLKENERAYEVMLLRDLYDNTYTDIAKEHNVSTGTVITVYHKIKIKQLRLYARHLAIVYGHKNTDTFRVNAVYDCYWDFRYVAAYFENEYRDILTEYRAGEPSMPEQFIATLPPLKEKINASTLNRIVQLREVEKKTYPAIGKELLLTEARARREYEIYYHKKVMRLFDMIKEIAGEAAAHYYLDLRCGAKKQLEIMRRDYPGLLESE